MNLFRVARFASWIALIAYVIVLATLTHMPKPPGVFEGHNDKTLHFLAYFCFGATLFTVLSLTWPKLKLVALATFVLGAGFAALDECTQSYFGRSADVQDWRADLMGLLGAVVIMSVIRWCLERYGPLRLTGQSHPE